MPGFRSGVPACAPSFPVHSNGRPPCRLHIGLVLSIALAAGRSFQPECHFDRQGEIQPTVGCGASRCLSSIYRVTSPPEFRGYGRMPEHYGVSGLVGSLVARLLARLDRDDTAVACKMTRLGVTSPCILALVGALPRVRPFFLFTVAPGLLVRTRGLNNSLKKLEASSTKISQYFLPET